MTDPQRTEETRAATDADETAIDEAPADAPSGTAGHDEAELPSTEELEEPSTEKSPAEAPKAPPRDEPEPSHRAVGIGVVDDASPPE